MTVQELKIHRAHHSQPVLTTGQPLENATGAVVLVHGRGATAHSILPLAAELAHPDLAYLAPQAEGNTWYPHSFLAPIERNEPRLSSSLIAIDDLVNHLGESGLSPENVLLLGFSQGACLALEYAARHAQRYGGLVGLSGSLIGPDGTARDYPGSLAGTPIFLGCSDVDFHIPKERVKHSAEVLERLGGRVTTRLYPNMGHTINKDELNFAREMVKEIDKA